MKIVRLPVLATSFATCMVLMVAFLACVGLWALAHDPTTHSLLPHILVGAPAVTANGIVLGLFGSLVLGNLLGATFALSFNLWNALAGRSQSESGR